LPHSTGGKEDAEHPKLHSNAGALERGNGKLLMRGGDAY